MGLGNPGAYTHRVGSSRSRRRRTAPWRRRRSRCSRSTRLSCSCRSTATRPARSDTCRISSVPACLHAGRLTSGPGLGLNVRIRSWVMIGADTESSWQHANTQLAFESASWALCVRMGHLLCVHAEQVLAPSNESYTCSGLLQRLVSRSGNAAACKPVTHRSKAHTEEVVEQRAKHPGSS